MGQECINMSTYQKTALGTAIAGPGIQSCSTMLLSCVLTSIVADFAISSTAGGTISTITNLGILAGDIILGTLADKYGRVKIFAIAVAIFSVTTGLTACSTSIATIYVLRFLVGVGGSGEYDMIMSVIVDPFAGGKRGRTTSSVTVAGRLGNIIAAIGAALIIPASIWRGLFVFGALPIFLTVFILRKLPESEAWKAVKRESVTKKSGIRDLFTESRAFTTICLTIMVIAQVVGYFGLMNWLPPILRNRAGLNIPGSSIWMIVAIVGMSLGMLVFGQIMGEVGAKAAYTSFLIASAIAVFIYSFANFTMLILVRGAIIGFFTNGMDAGYGAIVSNPYPAHIRATVSNTIFSIGRATGDFSSAAAGFFLDNCSLTVAMAFLTVLYRISLITVTTLQIHKPKPAETQAQEVDNTSIYLRELKHGDLGEATIIVGDPSRVSLLAEAFDKRGIVVNNHEFLLMNGYYKNREVSVCSTGIGVGSTEICVSELLESGAEQIVRCGGCGAWRGDVEPGDIILNTGMTQTTGSITTCVPGTYPAVADSLLVNRVAKHLSGSKKVHIGLRLAAETYYIGQEGDITIKGRAPPVPNMIKERSNLGIMNCEMGATVLYILTSLYQIPTANCLAIHVSQKDEKWKCEEDYRKLHSEMAQLVLDTMLGPSSQHENG